MRRRFGRGRRVRGSGESKSAPIDAARAFERILVAGIVEADAIEPVSDDGIGPNYAAVGVAEGDGGKFVVGYAPRNAGDAALAAVAVAGRLAAEEGFRGEALAVAPQWSAAARRRVAALASVTAPFRFRAVAHAALADDGGVVESDAGDSAVLVPVQQVAAGLALATDRELFLRAAAAMEGLAAKHGGAVRGVESSIELVLLARRVAAIHAGDDGARLEMLQDERSNTPLTADDLATAMDRLEGLLRKRLNDRRVRGGEEGLRAQLVRALAQIAGVRNAQLWPIGGSDNEVVDLVGVHDDGRPIVGAIRKQLTLSALGGILDAALGLRPFLPGLLASAGPPLRIATPRLLLAAQSFDDAALRVLASLALENVAFNVKPRRGRDPVLELREGEVAAPVIAVVPVAETAETGEAAPETQPSSTVRGRSRGRGRRGGRRSRGSDGDQAETASEVGVDEGAEAAESPVFDEVSLFDLADDRSAAAEAVDENGARRGRRGRGRSRGRRDGFGVEEDEEAAEGAASSSAEDGASAEAPESDAEESGRPTSSRRRGRRRGRRGAAAAADDLDEDDLGDVDDLSETLVPLEEVPDLGEVSEPVYDDDDDEEDDVEADLARRRREAEQRVRAAGEDEPSPVAEEKLSMPRKRAAIVVHADRVSLLCGLLLGRDLRQVEGLWVYGQEDLMTFFRGVATDLGDGTPIYVIGFTASPARDALQAASLYRGRLAWFDHHEWPPEDLEAMRDAIGNENLHVTPGAENCLAEIVLVRTRRSRFSDKLVELATGRFSQHDFERWGRLWWHRLGEIANSSGERRADIDPLLAGRPSDLAKAAAEVPAPPVAPEVAFVSERDFRLVHFHGFTLVVVPTPGEFDLHLVARIARERYDAQVSVAAAEGKDLIVLGADEGRGRRGLDLSGMVEHLATKHEWVAPLPDEDHVARLRIRDFAAHPERFDELISEIAMGRSILEG
jgi:hypothetical protein